MSKKHRDDESLHENKDLDGLIQIDDKLDKSKFITTDTFPIASTVKMTNPGEDTKITIQNITNFSSDSKEESKVEPLLDIKMEEPHVFQDSKKELKPISIVDVSKKKDDSHKPKFENPLLEVVNKVSKIIDIKQFTEKVDVDAGIEKALESLIYVGGGVIAATSITSKALANVGSFIINRK